MVSMPAIREETVPDERLTEVTRAPLNLMCKWTGNNRPAAKTHGGTFQEKNNFAFHSIDAQQIETTWDRSLRVGVQSLPQVKDFKYLRVLFMFVSEGEIEQESDRLVGVASLSW